MTSIALAQASLLLTFWCGPEGEHRSIRHWADVTISHALEAGINLKSATKGLPPKQQGLLRRLWWCCYMRDRLVTCTLALGTNRLHRIRDSDFNTPELSENDFDIIPGGTIERPLPQGTMCSYALHQGRRQELASLCVAQLSLCQSLTQVFSAQNIVVNLRPRAETDDDQGDPREKHELAFTSCIRDLLQWQQSLPPILACQAITPNDKATASTLSAAVNRAVIHKSYYTVTVYLYRHRLQFLQSPDITTWSMEKEMCNIFMENAAQRLFDISRNMHEYGINHSLLCVGQGLAKPLIRDVAFNIKTQSQDVEKSYREKAHEQNSGQKHGVPPSSYSIQGMQTALADLTEVGRETVPTTADTYTTPQHEVLECKADLFGRRQGVQQTSLPVWTWDMWLGSALLSDEEALD